MKIVVIGGTGCEVANRSPARNYTIDGPERVPFNEARMSSIDSNEWLRRSQARSGESKDESERMK